MTKLGRYRKSKALRLQDIGKLLGISPQGVRQQEQNGIHSIRTAQRYAAVLGCSPLDLLDIPEDITHE